MIFRKKILFIFIFLLISGCDKHIEKKYLSKDVEEKSLKELAETIPDDEYNNVILHKKVKEPEIVIPELLKQKISLSLNENLPIKSVLYATAKKLNIDFQIDPTIDTRIIFSAHNRPFIEVLDSVCDMADLRYSIRGNFVFVTKDIPYTDTYSLQFLNFSRDSENKISIATEVSTYSQQQQSSSHDAKVQSATIEANPNSSVVVKTKNDFWAELENGIKIIVGGDSKTALYSINKQSGVITVSANSKVHKYVKQYIEMIKSSTESQVLIEAKIIEVDLKNEYKRGIDWNFLSDVIDIKNSAAGTTTNFIGNFKGKNMSVILKALEKFGSTRTISNPRITAMNNQAAILKVAKNHVYFKLSYDKTYATTDNGRDNTTVSSEVHTVPIGLVMFVQPSIDIVNGTITLFLRPTISKLSGNVTDPAVDIAIRSMDQNIKGTYEPSRIPVTEVREVSSVLKLNDGEVAILGGFMEIRSSKDKEGIPLIKEVPVIGQTFASLETGDQIVELVILIKVRIAGEQPYLQKAADIRLQRFVPDPRPF